MVVHVDGGVITVPPPSVAIGDVVVAGGLLPLPGVVPLAPPLPVAAEVLPPPVVPEPVGALPVPVGPVELPEPLEEHEPVSKGMQTKSVPQSASTLHGSCHLKAQREVVVWVQVEGVGVGAGTGSHFVFAGQATATAVPPVHAEMVSLRQTISAPQSPSVVQGAGKQVMVTVPVESVVPVVPVVTGVGQSAPFGQAGVAGGGAVVAWQVEPDGQSVLAAQAWARAAVGMARPAKITTIEPIQARGLFNDMVSPV